MLASPRKIPWKRTMLLGHWGRGREEMVWVCSRAGALENPPQGILKPAGVWAPVQWGVGHSSVLLLSPLPTTALGVLLSPEQEKTAGGAPHRGQGRPSFHSSVKKDEAWEASEHAGRHLRCARMHVGRSPLSRKCGLTSVTAQVRVQMRQEGLVRRPVPVAWSSTARQTVWSDGKVQQLHCVGKQFSVGLLRFCTFSKQRP